MILGEVHDNPDHHRFQAEAVRELAPQAIVFEMFDDAAAARLKGIDRTDAVALEAALDWNARGWPDLAQYAPIFSASGAATIFGGALPRDDVRRAIDDGAAAVFGAEAARFGLDLPLDPKEQSDREAGQLTAHCDALPEAMLPGMVEAQRLRDAGLARAVVRAIEATGGSVVVITGNGHARRDWGIPTVLTTAAPEISVTAFAQLEATPEGSPPFDQWRITPPAPREDPCAAFR